MTKLRPFLRYYGGKWRAAPRYPAPEFDTIVEPFAGAAGYSTRNPAKDVILIDSYEVIAGIWSWLIDVSESEFMALPTRFDDGQTVDDFGLCQEAAWFLGYWVNNGVAVPCKRPSSWMRKHPDVMWGEKIRSDLAGQLQYIRHWHVIHGDYARSAPDIEATWFVDPPYSNKAGTLYKHSSKALCFKEMACWVESLRGQVIVCENLGADWLPFQPLMENRSTHGAMKTEVIWTNMGAA